MRGSYNVTIPGAERWYNRDLFFGADRLGLQRTESYKMSSIYLQ